MNLIIFLVITASVDLFGRAACLLYLLNNSRVKRLKYRTWVLLTAFVNFAWIFFIALGRGEKNDKEN